MNEVTAAEWEVALVGTDDDPGLLDRYFVGESKGTVFWLCRRCPTVNIIARNLDGDQTNLTLGEMVQSALGHEREKHDIGGAT